MAGEDETVNEGTRCRTRTGTQAALRTSRHPRQVGRGLTETSASQGHAQASKGAGVMKDKCKKVWVGELKDGQPFVVHSLRGRLF